MAEQKKTKNLKQAINATKQESTIEKTMKSDNVTVQESVDGHYLRFPIRNSRKGLWWQLFMKNT